MKPASLRFLTINGGSSSIKVALFTANGALERSVHGKLDRIGLGGTNLTFNDAAGWTPHFVEGHEPELMHKAMATTLDAAIEQIKNMQQDAGARGNLTRPRWPMIVLDSPKGWTGHLAPTGALWKC